MDIREQLFFYILFLYSMSNLRSLATELNQKTINILKYGRGYAGKSLSLFMFNITDLNQDYIDWKNIKPKPFKSEIKENMLSDSSYGNKVTWQEINLKDQVLTINSVDSGTQVTCACSGPLTYKRGQTFWNPNTQTGFQLTADASQATSWAGTIVLTVSSSAWWTAGDSLRMSGYAKPYGLAEGNAFDADQVTEEYNIFTGANMALQLDQNEVNSNYIFQGDAKAYLKQKTLEASRKLIINVWRSTYAGQRTTNTIGGATSYQAGGLDRALKNLSGKTGINLGGATGAATGEIKIAGATTAARRSAFLDAVTEVHLSPLPNIKGNNKLVFMCTTPFMREVEEMFYDKLLVNDTLSKIDIEVTTVKFSGGVLTFITDEMLDDLNRYYDSTTGAYSIKKLGYFVPIDYCKAIVKANDVVTKDGLSVPALWMGKYFIPPQTAEETFDLRLYTSYSFMRWGITSGAYRKVTLAW